MQGIRSISDELDTIVSQIPDAQLPAVVDVVLHVTLAERADDLDVLHAIELYRNRPEPSKLLADTYSASADRYDCEYSQHEDEGNKIEAKKCFKKMCIFFGLAELRKAPQMDQQAVDDLIYNLGHGSHDPDSFGPRIIDRLSAMRINRPS